MMSFETVETRVGRTILINSSSIRVTSSSLNVLLILSLIEPVSLYEFADWRDISLGNDFVRALLQSGIHIEL